MLVALISACGISYWVLGLNLPYTTLLWVLGALCGLNLLTLARMRCSWPVTDAEFFIQLQFDLISIAVLLYFSGGASNPFISYLLVPVCIAAATLRALPSWAIAVSAVGIYSLLLFYHIPIPALAPHHSHHQNPMNLHIIGMWLNFLISALLVTYFVVSMAKTLRAREQQLRKFNEDNLRNEQLLAVATLAAGTAHELGTPLATMKVLLGEMRDDYKSPDTPAELSADLNILTSQVDHCSKILRQLVNQAELDKDGISEASSVALFCQNIIDRWLLLNPKVTANILFNDSNASINALIPATVAQSILSLLNNAADANPKNIVITIAINQTELRWTILDNGPGIPADLMEKLGKPFISNKKKGFGLGLFLSHTTLSRYDGSIQLYNRAEGGTRTELTLPISEVSL